MQPSPVIVQRHRCPKIHYSDNGGRTTFNIVDYISIDRGEVKAVALNKKTAEKFLVSMVASDKAGVSSLLKTTYSRFKVCRGTIPHFHASARGPARFARADSLGLNKGCGRCRPQPPDTSPRSLARWPPSTCS